MLPVVLRRKQDCNSPGNGYKRGLRSYRQETYNPGKCPPPPLPPILTA